MICHEIHIRSILQKKGYNFKVTLLTGGVVAAGILVLMPFVGPITRLLLPEDYAVPVATFYRILAIGYVILPFGSTHEAFYVATNTLRAWFWISAVGTATLLPLNIYLIKTVPYTGTAWGLSAYLSWVLAHFFYIGYFFRKARTRAVWEGQDMGDSDAGAPQLDQAGQVKLGAGSKD